ncbi:histidine phosphatase family protein [Bifidobacterium sp. SMB2]|uniref:Histidine phosphatase family protein n=1 Tax=Bifidobacterium saimiriisciurei TaxID=2661627 RepID=A0ABX0CEN1_9BIFI|nr:MULTISPECIES: histidine phosphatase family protein [Bifidobacterium]NEG96042.1 histidine phosphatase family protein [Bifidobacterium sp. SMB2]NEH10880.1 histidine phosphatase family protein [Bifidobacterium saimiriisciurei]
MTDSNAAPCRHVRSITLIRHGRTAFNAVGRLQGQSDIPLDDVGLWQVGQSGLALRRLYVDPADDARRQVVVSSDLERSMQTAHAFADPLELEVHADVRVRERDFGEWEGLTLHDIHDRWPDDFFSWIGFRGGELRHGAESKLAVGERGVEVVRDWATRFGGDTDLFVFSHGAWISQTLQVLIGLNQARPDFSSLMSMRNAHWCRLRPMDRPDGSVQWRLAAFNHGPAAAETDGWDEPKLP